jgi:hypothetical protein
VTDAVAGPRAARLGVSSCLLGQEVRYEGDHAYACRINGVLGRHFEFVSIWPIPLKKRKFFWPVKSFPS